MGKRKMSKFEKILFEYKVQNAQLLRLVKQKNKEIKNYKTEVNRLNGIIKGNEEIDEQTI